MSGWLQGGWHEGAYSGRSELCRSRTNREVGVVAAVLVAGSEKAAAHRLGL